MGGKWAGALLGRNADNVTRSSVTRVDIIELGTDRTVIPDAGALFDATFLRVGDDLYLYSKDGSVTIVSNYFSVDPPPNLYGPNGAVLNADVIKALVGPLAPAQVAQTTQTQGDEEIGQVELLTGAATSLLLLLLSF